MNETSLQGWDAVLYASLMLSLVFLSLVHLLPKARARKYRCKPKPSQPIVEAEVRPELSDPDGHPWPPG